MHTLNMYQSNAANAKNFWDGLQIEILNSSQKLSKDNIKTLIEENFVFSLLSRGCSQIELMTFQSLLHISDYGYVITVELSPLEKTISSDFEMNMLAIHKYIKNCLKDSIYAIGPLNENRISIIISSDTDQSGQNVMSNALSLGNALTKELSINLNIYASIGIGKLTSIFSVYTSYVESLSCLHYSSPGQSIHAMDLDYLRKNHHFDYEETEKYMLDAIRLRKVEAYDYFAMLMEWIHPFSDKAKRNRILEIIVLTAHAMHIDNANHMRFYNYLELADELKEYDGTRLIEWTYEKFISITGYVKPHNSIDYSNRIVQTTREYLENHYSKDISLEEVAAQVNISPQYFSKLIKKTTGFNFIDWLSTLRVKKAKELLSDPNLTVKEVCFMVGYKDPNYFSRIFKKRIGITPSEYIKHSSNLNNKN
jgi:two-component system response regulator YesN